MLTGKQKKKLCLKNQMNPKITGIELAHEFNIGEGTVSGILREKDKWLSIDSDMPKLSLTKKVQTQLEQYFDFNVNN